MSDIRVAAGPHTFAARFDWWLRAGVRFTTVLLYRERIIHERCWISLCAVNPGLPDESATSPRRRDKSSSIPPGSAKPKSSFGMASAISQARPVSSTTRFLTIVGGLESLCPLGELAPCHGAQKIEIAAI